MLLAALAVALAAPERSSALVISEINYNPPAGEEALEFVELANDTWTPDDLSGYSFSEGIEFVFPPGTILDARARIVVCADAGAVRERYGIENVAGDFGGRLDASGERITLVNHVGVVVASVRYSDGGKWPVGPDGTGHTLVLRSLYLDPSEPESWTRSPELGGSPGRPNFPDDREVEFDVTVHVDAGEDWRFRRGTGPFSEPPDAWEGVDFDDSAWEVGPSGFGFGDDDDATVLADMRGNYSSVAIRKRFVLTAEAIGAPGDIFLGMTFDDGFCAFLNGVEVARDRCPETIAWDATATRSTEAREEKLYLVDRSLLREGENVLAIAGFNSTLNGSDFSLIPRLITRRVIVEEGPIDFAGRFNELFRGARPGEGWVEIHNPGAMPLDLSGVRLTADPDRTDPFVFAPGTTLAGGGFLVVSEADAGLDLSQPRLRLFLIQPDGRVLTASAFDAIAGVDPGDLLAEARFPDGGRPGWLTDTPTPGEPNVVPRVTSIVINEIYYHPPEDRPGEFIELYNRGETPVDLSGFRFTKGIDFEIPGGTVLGAGEYLVVAEDPALLREHWSIEGALGPWRGQLANGGENIRLVDRLGNLVDEVRYRDGGRWSLWADGRGASLELIDPRQDNDFAAAWAPSDESDKTQWEELSYEVPRYAPAGESELHILLAERGICRIDDVSIVRQGTEENIIPNPGFEENTRPWRIEGTHVDSRRTEEDSHGGVASLEVVATGKGDSLCNRIETDTSPRMAADAYRVSLWARWIRGTSLLILHGEFASGPWFGTRDVNLSNNSLGARLRMTVPWNIGTPGRENSARIALRDRTGSDNLGPVIAEVVHRPAVPEADMRVTVVARVSDADGVARVVVRHRIDAATSEFDESELLDDGMHGDGRAGDGVYGGAIGPFPLNRTIVYHIAAEDTAGAVRTFPVGAPEERLIFAVAPVGEQAFLVQDRASISELTRRRLHSNDLVPATFIYDRSEVYYDVGIRYRGSPWGRPAKQGYRIAFPGDRPFLRGRKTMNLTNRDRVDGAAYFMIARNGTPSSIAPAADYRFVRARVNTQPFGQPGFSDTVDRDYIEKWFGPEAARDAVVLKGNGRLRFNDGCTRTGWDEATLLHMGTSSENYRFYYQHSTNQTRDDWKPYMELTRVIDAKVTPAAELDRLIDGVLDVERFFRVFGPRILMNDGDALYFGNGHNGYLVWDPVSGLFSYLPFDLGFAFNTPNGNLFGVRDRGVARLLARPRIRRTYLRTVHELLNGYWSDEVAGPYLDALQRAGGVGRSARSFLRSTRPMLLARMRAFTNVDFRITTNGGEDIVTAESRIVLEGEAPVQIARFLLQRNDEDELVDLDPSFPTASRPTTWSAGVDLPAAVNRLTIFGLDGAGDVIGTAGITVTRGTAFVRGDADGNGRVNVNDAVEILLELFAARPSTCADASDVDDSGSLEITDAIRLLEHLFLRGRPPAAPFPEPGGDPTPDDLACE